LGGAIAMACPTRFERVTFGSAGRIDRCNLPESACDFNSWAGFLLDSRGHSSWSCLIRPLLVAGRANLWAHQAKALRSILHTPLTPGPVAPAGLPKGLHSIYSIHDELREHFEGQDTYHLADQLLADVDRHRPSRPFVPSDARRDLPPGLEPNVGVDIRPQQESRTLVGTRRYSVCIEYLHPHSRTLDPPPSCLRSRRSGRDGVATSEKLTPATVSHARASGTPRRSWCLWWLTHDQASALQLSQVQNRHAEPGGPR